MKTLVLFISILALPFGSTIPGKTFPQLQGETLSDKTMTIPDDTMGKITLVGMAYSKKSESLLKSWYTPMYDKFVLKRGMFDSQYDVNMLFVPMYTGTKKAAYNVSIKKMKESSRKDLYPYLLFYKGSLEPYVSELEMKDKDQPYFFVLDEKGEILYSTKGLYTEGKMEKIEEILDSRL